LPSTTLFRSDKEKKLETLEQWQEIGGVTTFPVLSHTHHDSGDGCRDSRAVAIQEPFFIPEEFKIIDSKAFL
jgi:hypothetical protein